MQFLVILRVKPSIPNEQIGSLVKPEAQKVWEGIKSVGEADMVFH